MVDKRRYEDVVFLQGEEADEALAILDEEGEEAALEYLKQWHYPGEHDARASVGTGSSDDTYEDDGYTMSWNKRIGYIGLMYDSHYDTLPSLNNMEGEFVRIVVKKENGDIIMFPTEAGVDLAVEAFDYSKMENRSITSAEDEFLEEAIYPLGFEYVSAEDVGALTDAPLIGYDDEVWGYMDYQIKSFIEDFMQGKPAFWTRG